MPNDKNKFLTILNDVAKLRVKWQHCVSRVSFQNFKNHKHEIYSKSKFKNYSTVKRGYSGSPKPPICKPLAAGAGPFLTSRSRRRSSIGSAQIAQKN
jgi:hypothetical protein